MKKEKKRRRKRVKDKNNHRISLIKTLQQLKQME